MHSARDSRHNTHATGSEEGEQPSPRPPTCGWEAPLDRLGNRSSASQRTRLCGRGGLIGLSLLTDPTNTRKRDMCVSLGLRRLVHVQRQQPCARPLGHLAVLLLAPTVLATKLGATLAHELACQHELLIARELVREPSDAAQIVAQEGQMLDVGTRVGHVHPTTRAPSKGK